MSVSYRPLPIGVGFFQIDAISTPPILEGRFFSHDTHDGGDGDAVPFGRFFLCGSDVRDPLSVVAGKTGWIPLPCPSVLLNPYGQVWERASTLIGILKLSVYGSVKVLIR